MELNPIKAMSEQLEKLINEHGSATVLKERLALFKDQLVAADKQIVALNTKIVTLEAEKAVLSSENGDLENTIETLKSQLEDCTKEIKRQKEIANSLQLPQRPKINDPITTEIIKLFFDAGREISINEITSKFSLQVSVAQYHIDILLDLEFIELAGGISFSLDDYGPPVTYEITPSGRKYVMES